MILFGIFVFVSIVIDYLGSAQQLGSIELPPISSNTNMNINSSPSVTPISPGSQHNLSSSSISILDDAFWELSNLKHYTTLISTLAILMANIVLINLVFVESTIVTEAVGFSALLLESTLAMPQLYRNHINKSCAGLSLELVAAWVIGDLFKTVLFISRGSPAPFILCGLIQLSVDFGVVFQLYIYSAYNKASHFTSSKR